MARIPEYFAQTPAQGGLGGRQATAADFSDGEGLATLGTSIQGVADQIEQRQSEDDVTNVRLQVMKQHAELTKRFQDESLKAPAGDPEFATRFENQTNEYLNQGRAVAQTRKGQQTYDLLSGELTKHFAIKAGEFQVQSAGVKAKLDFAGQLKYAGNSLVADPGSYGIVRQLTLASINDPDSTYARKGVPKEALIQLAEEELSKGYFEGLLAAENPEFARRQLMSGKWDDKITSADKLSLILRADADIRRLQTQTKQVDSRRIAEEAIEAGSRRALDTPRAAAPRELSTATASYAPIVQRNAEATGVDPNILLAQIQAESAGNPNAASPAGARGVSQFIPGTAQRYGVDVTNVESSISGQARYMSDLLRMFGGDYQKALAGYNWGENNVSAAVAKYGNDWLSKAPAETRNYVAKIMANVAAPSSQSQGTSHDIRAGLDQAYDAARRIVRERYGDDPVMNDLVASHINSYITRQAKAQEAIQIQANDSLVKVLMEKRPTSQDELLATPEMARAFATITPVQRRGILAGIEHNAREANGRSMKSIAAVNEEVFDRINLPADDPNKIWNVGQLAPYFARGLTRADYEWHKKQIDDQPTEDGQRVSDVRKNFFDAIKPRFDSSTMMVRDEKGAEDNFKFKQFALDKERRFRAEKKDPYSIYNPNSPDYLGNDVPAFQRTLQQKIKDRVETIKGPAIKPEQVRKPGESIADWKKRTGL